VHRFQSDHRMIIQGHRLIDLSGIFIVGLDLRESWKSYLSEDGGNSENHLS